MLFTNFNKLFFSLPIKLTLVILSSFLLGSFLPESLKSILLTTSLAMKEVLLFVLPAIVFFLVFSSFAQLSGGFIVFTGLLVSLVCISNFTSLMIAYPIGVLTQDFIITTKTISYESSESLELLPCFTLDLPKICNNSTALILGVLLGIYTSSMDNVQLKKFAVKGSALANLFLAKIFTPVLPIFILGFILKAQHDGLLVILFKNFIPLLSVIILLYTSYISFIYIFLNNFRIKKASNALKNIVPAAIVGFSSMSSAAAMPVLISGTEKNSKDKDLQKRVIPFTTNTHMMGDALAIPLIAISFYVVEYSRLPDAEEYLIFAIGYVLAKFASAGIPGGTILIMTPILESKLGFTSEMSSMILTTYLLFDPFCTLGNIFGNGAFSIAFEKLRNTTIQKKGNLNQLNKQL